MTDLVEATIADMSCRQWPDCQCGCCEDRRIIAAEIERLQDGFQRAVGDLVAAAAERDRLRRLLNEAADDIEHWGGYAGDYFRNKWHLEDDIKKYRDASK